MYVNFLFCFFSPLDSFPMPYLATMSRSDHLIQIVCFISWWRLERKK